MRIGLDNPQELLIGLGYHGRKAKGLKQEQPGSAQVLEIGLFLHESRVNDMRQRPVGSIGKASLQIRIRRFGEDHSRLVL